jgi:hypothetical protein
MIQTRIVCPVGEMGGWVVPNRGLEFSAFHTFIQCHFGSNDLDSLLVGWRGQGER